MIPDLQNDILHRQPRNFFRRISLLACSSVLKFVLQLAIIILYSRKLSLTDYGVYQFIWMYINFFSLLGIFGLSSLVLSVPPAHIREWIGKNKKTVLGFFAVLNGSAIFFLMLCENYFSVPQTLLLICLLILQNIMLIAESIAIKNEQEKKLFGANMIYICIYGFVHFYLLYNTYSVTILLGCIVAATLLKCILLLYRIKFSGTATERIPDIGRQWFLLGVNDMLTVLVKWIDKWLILFFLSAAQFALYFNGTYEIPVFMLILGAVGNISLVEFSKIKKDHNKAVKSLFERSSLLMAAIIFPSFWFLLFYSTDFFVAFFGTKYLAAIPIFKITLLMLPARIIYSTTVLQVYKRTDLILKGSILDFIIAVILMFIFYPLWQMKGLAMVFVISTYIQLAYYLWHTGRLIKENVSFFFPFKKILLIMLSTGLLIAACRYGLAALGILPRLAAGASLCAILILSGLRYFYKRSSPA